jgi:dihydroorotate dehydrogenase electron transfer subunit
MHPELPVAVRLLESRPQGQNMCRMTFERPQRPPSPDAPRFNVDKVRPGQFVMIWLPGVNEKPYVLSHRDKERFGITVYRRGTFSKGLCDLQPGARVGFRGPYGRGFSEIEDSPESVIIGGGCGMASLSLLKERLPHSTMLQGSPTADDLLYRDRFPNQIIYTDDGSAGRKGFPTEWLEQAIEEDRVRRVFTCGPEVLMAKVVHLCLTKGVPCQAAMERHMKCGIGVCGQCECDGRLVCREGPVFSAEELSQMPSFGAVRRDKTGKVIPISNAEQCPLQPNVSEA